MALRHMVAHVKGAVLAIYLYLAHSIGCDDYVTPEMTARAIFRRIIYLSLLTAAKIVDRVLGKTNYFSGKPWGYNGVCDRFRVCMESLMSLLGFPRVQVPDVHLIILATAYGIFSTVVETGVDLT